MNNRVKILVEGALCVALSLVLNFVVLFSFPNGGTITLFSMTPVLYFAFKYGLAYGLIISVAVIIFQMLYLPFFLNPFSVILDYILPFGAISLPGLFGKKYRLSKSVTSNKLITDENQLQVKINEININSNKYDGNKNLKSELKNTHNSIDYDLTQSNQKYFTTKKQNVKKQFKFYFNFWLGVLLYFLIRYFSHVLSGVLYWSQAIDFLIWQGDLSGIIAWAYSLTYNALYLLPDTILALIGGIIILNINDQISKNNITGIE